MPFDSQGNFTLPAAATDAFAGKVIASADWNSIFTSEIAGMTILGQMNWTNGPRVISASGNFSVATTDAFIFVKASAPTITLPLSSTKTCPVKILGGATGIFSSHNSAVVPTGSDTISGLTTLLLNVDYQVATFYPLSSGGYVATFG